MDSLFFIFSKIAWVFLSPGNLLVIALVLATLYLMNNHVRAAKKIFIPTAIIGFIAMAYPVGDFLMKPLESRFSQPQSMPKNIDGIILLGGGEDLKRSLSWNVAELGIGGDRYIAAAKLAAQYPKAPIIFTGGSSIIQLQDSNGEGAIAKQILTTIGIDEKRLIIESSSRNTYENFLYSQPRLPKTDGTYLLITSAYHMPRSVGIARNLGIKIVPYPVDYRSSSNSFRHWDFNLYDHLKVMEPAFREWIGLTVYYWTDKTSEWYPKPE